ncbi:MAG: hypothetical protein ACXADS_10040 [Candidatus Thorarchaeota archaeon]
MGGTDFEHLFEKATSEDIKVRAKALSQLGQNLIQIHTEQFAQLLKVFFAEGEFDVTGWNRLAVEVMVDVCSLQNQGFRFKKKDKTITVVRFPEGPMRELFVRDIVEDPW